MNFLKKSALSFLITGLLIILSDSAINAQDICHLVQLKVDKVRGRVVTNDEIPYPFSSTKIELFREKKGGLIGSAITDKNGYFEIENIGKGEYVLVVWATTEKGLTLFTYDVNLHVTKRKQNKTSNKMIYVNLGGDCFDSGAKLGEETRTPAALNNSELLKKQVDYFKAFGVKNDNEFQIRGDTAAEKNAIPVIQQRYANVSKTVPPSVQNAINKLQRR